MQKLSGHHMCVGLRGKDFKNTAFRFMMMSTPPFAFDIVENSMRIMMDGDDNQNGLL